ncbi:polysaccharide deacetylase family protein [Ekhidna sp.]|uniref:polysaccharide deacetylase family protein n=1 Tax=Ekhidna sp. TaxID=2608089 RepID=UPI0035190D1F
MIRFYKTPWITRALYSSLTWRIPSKDSIFLTFDDGPHPEATSWVLDQLDQVNAKATFFCLGRNLEAHSDLAENILVKGHKLGNHSFNHLKGWKTDDVDYLNDLALCDQQLKTLDSQTSLFRPPYGRISRSQLKKLSDKQVVMWSHLSWDFDPDLNVEKSLKKLKQAKPGSILVFHDSAKAFKNLKQILPEILAHFHAKGLKFEAIKS